MFQFCGNIIQQNTSGFEKEWTIPELFETYNPLPGEALNARNQAMRNAVDVAMDMYSDLSETARLRYDFWKQLCSERIEREEFKYSIKITNTYQWTLTINAEGLFYKDISGQFSPRPGMVYEQLFSDFWFYGPLMPLPDLHTRKWIIAKIRNAFIQAGSPASYQHFQCFEYPRFPVSPLQWTDGDAQASDFVTVRDFGIEWGRSNWHDGLVYLNFLSFEHFLNVPLPEHVPITPAMRAEINELINAQMALEKVNTARSNDLEQAGGLSFSAGENYSEKSTIALLADNAESKRLFMNNGGLTHYIYLDGNGDRYSATPAEEAKWRAELLENYTQRIKVEDDGVILTHIARNMQLNGATNVEDLLLAAAENAPPKSKQGLAQALVEVFNSDKGAEILISLLELEVQDSYWRNYVFNCFFRMRNNQKVQAFLIECLQGEKELWFKKSVDVLRMWGHFGETALTDNNLLNALNWEDATAADPNFRAAFDKVIKIIKKK